MTKKILNHTCILVVVSVLLTFLAAGLVMYGKYNEDTISLLKENGCKLGLTTEVALISSADYRTDVIYKIPRLDTNDIPKDANANSLENKWY